VDAALIDLLSCPECGRSLAETAGSLGCEQGHSYPIVRGIPRLFDAAHQSEEQARTSDAFGYSWTHYPRDNPYTEEQWGDWVVPLTPEDFAGKRVLDVGCGLGGFIEYSRRWGARQAAGVDLSEAIDAAAARLGPADLVQGDLNRLPFRPGSFDLAYSIGVLHHLEDPERGFRAVVDTVRPGGLVFVWVYGRENNGWIIYVVDPLRKHVFLHLPHGLLKWAISLPLALVLMPFVKLAERVERMPYRDYLLWLGRRDVTFVHGVVFDHLAAPTSHYIRREEFERWFRDAGLEDIQISWRNRNSWRGLGRVPDSGARSA
jgi:SAM-dependent methyltransferase